jgi:hypothetical protein
MVFVMRDGETITATPGVFGHVGTKTGRLDSPATFPAANQQISDPLVATRIAGNGTFVQDTYNPSSMQQWNELLNKWRSDNQVAWDRQVGSCQLKANGHDAKVTFPATDPSTSMVTSYSMCRQFAELWDSQTQAWKSQTPGVGTSWMPGTPAQPSQYEKTSCKVTVASRPVTVTDTGGQDYGSQACSLLQAISNGSGSGWVPNHYSAG